MKKILSLFVCVVLATAAFAQQEKSVRGTYVYSVTDDKNITFAEARLNAIANARREALKEAFGVNMSVESAMLTDVKDGISHEAMLDMTSESLKGEWVADKIEPNVDVTYDKETRTFNYLVTVSGTAKERRKAKTDIVWDVHVGGKTKADISNQIVGKKRVYVSFRSPIDGYVAIYLRDSKDDMNCLLPYKNSGVGSFKVKAGEQYLFFDRTIDENANPIQLSTSKDLEIDALYVVFSPNSFNKCRDTSVGNNRPNIVSSTYFHKWLIDSQNQDKEMEEMHKWLKIVKE